MVTDFISKFLNTVIQYINDIHSRFRYCIKYFVDIGQSSQNVNKGQWRELKILQRDFQYMIYITYSSTVQRNAFLSSKFASPVNKEKGHGNLWECIWKNCAFPFFSLYDLAPNFLFKMFHMYKGKRRRRNYPCSIKHHAVKTHEGVHS
jgi:hypothetical protein